MFKTSAASLLIGCTLCLLVGAASLKAANTPPASGTRGSHSAPAPLEAGRAKESIVGGWRSKNGTARMAIMSAGGLVNVIGGDPESFFEGHCVSVGDTMHCRGGGATLTGVGFVYESTLVAQEDGSMVEKWTATHPSEQKRGQDHWVRIEPDPR